MKLLIVTQTVDKEDPILGFFHAWIAEFAKDAAQVHVICLKVGKHDLPGNVAIHSLGKETNPSRLHYLFLFYRYVFKYRHEYDTVFVHMNPEYVVLGGMLWRMLQKKVMLWYAHGTVSLRLRVATFFAHAVATASAESFRLPSSKVIVVGHGIALPECTAQPFHDPLRLITVGRISPVKGHQLMFDTMELLASRGIHTELTVLGAPAAEADDAYLALLKTTVEKQALNVSWKGGVPHKQVAAHLCDADIFINCSRTGSLDKAVLEAAGAGLPLATSNDGLHSALAELDPSAVTPPTAEALADRISAIRTLTPEELITLQERYRAFVQDHYGLSVLVKKIMRILTV